MIAELSLKLSTNIRRCGVVVCRFFLARTCRRDDPRRVGYSERADNTCGGHASTVGIRGSCALGRMENALPKRPAGIGFVCDREPQLAREEHDAKIQNRRARRIRTARSRWQSDRKERRLVARSGQRAVEVQNGRRHPRSLAASRSRTGGGRCDSTESLRFCKVAWVGL